MSDEEEEKSVPFWWGYLWYFAGLVFIVFVAGLGMYATEFNKGGLIVGAVSCMVIWSAIILGMAPTEMGFASYCDRLPNPCNNGGKCISKGHRSYECQCLNGWEGPTCSSVDREDIENRPCRKDGINPCFHKAECTDISTHHDGIYDDFTCECPDIRGTDGEYKWEGKTCNNFPEDLDSSFYSEDDCSIAVDGKSERENRMLRYCQDSDRCFRWDKLPMKCKTDCDNTGTTVWCDATDRCIERADPIAWDACDSLIDIPYPGGDHPGSGELTDEERRRCNADISTDLIGDECVCADNLDDVCDGHESSQCNSLECCKFNASECGPDGSKGDVVYKIKKHHGHKGRHGSRHGSRHGKRGRHSMRSSRRGKYR